MSSKGLGIFSRLWPWGHRSSEEDEHVAPTQSVSQRPPRRPNKLVKKTALEYSRPYVGRRWAYEDPEYNLAEIGKAEDVESWVRRSITKHTRSILKEGWTLTGRNPRTVAYVERRLHELGLAVNNPIQAIVRAIVHDIVRFGNSMLITQRSEVLSPLEPHRVFSKDLKPIVGLFAADPTTMRVKRDSHGNVQRWQQRLQSHGSTKEFPKENVIHFYLDRKTGFAFGTPYILPVLDDIRMLRRLEEKVDIITHKHAFPLFHFKVGTEDHPAQEYDDGSSEVDDVRATMENIPLEGGIVTPERHSIEVIGVEGKAMNLQPLLEYFENRVLGGLHLTSIDVGRGNTANRGTATTMSTTFLEQCKEIQAVISETLSFFLLDQLLEEGGFDLSNENRVFLEFSEIDFVDRQIRETHAANLFNNHLITRSEARAIMRREPLTEEQLADTHLELIDLVLAEKAAQAKVDQIRAQATIRSQLQPTNQHGTKPGKTKSKNDSLESLVGNAIDEFIDTFGSPADTAELAATIIANLQDAGYSDIPAPAIENLVDSVFSRVYADAIQKWGAEQAGSACKHVLVSLFRPYLKDPKTSNLKKLNEESIDNGITTGY